MNADTRGTSINKLDTFPEIGEKQMCYVAAVDLLQIALAKVYADAGDVFPHRPVS